MIVQLFARARDLIGADRVEVPDAATIGALRRSLAIQYPSMTGLLATSAFAVNDEYADDNAAIPPGAEVALLPPVSGG